MDWYLKVVTNFFGFSGRARRKEYWMFILVNLIIAIILSVVDSVIGTAGLLSGLYSLAVTIPSLAVSIRRLHDIDKSGWWLLIGLIPIIGLLILVFVASEGTRGPNRFGNDPKEGEGGFPAVA